MILTLMMRNCDYESKHRGKIETVSCLYFGSGETIMFFIVLGISVFAVVSGVLFISYWKLDDKKDYLYDETDSFGKRQFKRWRF